ncbi:SusD-like starch-binding protein associating with outer membrane [Pseudobacter ginsenosidimutans]|uniref:SusD-like starch-binding protein associating with outer membrane n=2 Tax=Pseudobacter ginsenosidimutans TaxID=661488 RepID=A0A4Q7MHH0_9BACT|nr:SusD-like starch-binding protein associating with outer membrane [Pseudobacter ginsenosidimutans]
MNCMNHTLNGKIPGLCILVMLLLMGCKKFLGVRLSETVVNPTTVTDFKEMLNHDSLALCNFILADLMSDDVRMTDAMLQSDTSSFFAHDYLWAKDVWNMGDQDFMYNNAYSRILQMNIILSKIDEAQGDTKQKNLLRAQAQINRAWYYLQLANLYGDHYQTATAATALAVPLVLLPDANVLPARATVQQVYDQIIKDLTAAVNSADLPAMGQTIVQPGKAAGYALLARTYLFMGNYAAAETAAGAALELRSTLLNYNTAYTMPGVLIDLSKNPETLLGRLCSDNSFLAKYSGASFLISPALRDLFEDTDTRLTVNFGADGNYNTYQYGWQVFNYSVAVPELVLIKAECLARKADTDGALSWINRLRQNRLPGNSTPDNHDDVLKIVLEERRRELFFHGGLRLFDLKRLNREAAYAQTPERMNDDNTTVLSTLAPGSPRYLMQFSPIIIANNPNIVPNNR